MKKSVFQFICVFLFASLFISANQANQSQILKTQLVVTVLDNLGTIQKDAKVNLYKTMEDYNEHKNIIQETKITDAKGRVKYVGLEPIDYYIEITNGNKNNMFGGERTGKLEEGKINRVNVIISE